MLKRRLKRVERAAGSTMLAVAGARPGPQACTPEWPVGRRRGGEGAGVQVGVVGPLEVQAAGRLVPLGGTKQRAGDLLGEVLDLWRGAAGVARELACRLEYWVRWRYKRRA